MYRGKNVYGEECIGGRIRNSIYERKRNKLTKIRLIP